MILILIYGKTEPIMAIFKLMELPTAVLVKAILI